jgi:dephospho-CoA kinase
MTFVLGLTGSIGMGKSTTSAMFRAFDVPIYDADATVHALYQGKAAPLIEAAFPGTVIDGVVNRQLLGQRVLGDAEALKRLEAIVHPLVREMEHRFIVEQARAKTPLIVLDVPLLFETGGDKRVDAICVVTAPAEVQRQRVLDRKTMSEQQFEAILAKQMPDQLKRDRADCLIDTGQGLEFARQQVKSVIERYRSQQGSVAKAHLAEAELAGHSSRKAPSPHA